MTIGAINNSGPVSPAMAGVGNAPMSTGLATQEMESRLQLVQQLLDKPSLADKTEHHGVLQGIAQNVFTLSTLAVTAITWYLGGKFGHKIPLLGKLAGKHSGPLAGLAGLFLGSAVSKGEHTLKHGIQEYLDTKVDSPALYTAGIVLKDSIMAIILTSLGLIKEIATFWGGSQGANKHEKARNAKKAYKKMNKSIRWFNRKLDKFGYKGERISEFTPTESILDVPEQITKRGKKLRKEAKRNKKLSKWKRMKIAGMGGFLQFSGEMKDYKNWRKQGHLSPKVLMKDVPVKFAIGAGGLLAVELLFDLVKNLVKKVPSENVEDKVLHGLHLDPAKLQARIEAGQYNN